MSRRERRKRRKLRYEDVKLLKNYYISLDKPQLSLLHYFLSIDHPDFPKISCEWMRKILIRALNELGISVINCRPFDPHGKGKVERFIGTLQLQLPVWFRRYGVKSLKEANAVLRKYIEYYNRLQIHREIGSTPQERFISLKESSKFTEVGKTVDLEKIFSYRYERKVEKDNTIRFNGDVYQLERLSSLYSFDGKRAEVRYFPGRALSIYIDGKKVRWKKLPANRNNAKLERESYEKVAIL